jgi:hypothetical protein
MNKKDLILITELTGIDGLIKQLVKEFGYPAKKHLLFFRNQLISINDIQDKLDNNLLTNHELTNIYDELERNSSKYNFEQYFESTYQEPDYKNYWIRIYRKVVLFIETTDGLDANQKLWLIDNGIIRMKQVLKFYFNLSENDMNKVVYPDNQYLNRVRSILKNSIYKTRKGKIPEDYFKNLSKKSKEQTNKADKDKVSPKNESVQEEYDNDTLSNEERVRVFAEHHMAVYKKLSLYFEGADVFYLEGILMGQDYPGQVVFHGNASSFLGYIKELIDDKHLSVLVKMKVARWVNKYFLYKDAENAEPKTFTIPYSYEYIKGKRKVGKGYEI